MAHLVDHHNENTKRFARRTPRINIYLTSDIIPTLFCSIDEVREEVHLKRISFSFD